MKGLKFANFFLCGLNTVSYIRIVVKIAENDVYTEKSIALLATATLLVIIGWFLLIKALKK